MTVNTLEPIEIELWEPVPDKPGFVRQVGCRTIREIFRDLVSYLEAADVQFEDLDYFQPSAIARYENGIDSPFPDYHGIACYPVRGSSEGYYIHVDVIYNQVATNIYLGKTLFEGEEGFNRAAIIANTCAKALQA